MKKWRNVDQVSKEEIFRQLLKFKTFVRQLAGEISGQRLGALGATLKGADEAATAALTELGYGREGQGENE